MYDWAEFRHFLYLLTILEKGGFRAAAEVDAAVCGIAWKHMIS